MQSSLSGVLPQNSETAAKTSCMLLPGSYFQAFVVEELAFGIFGFGHAVGDQDQPVSCMQAVAVAFIIPRPATGQPASFRARGE